jgi:hypothetical protein
MTIRTTVNETILGGGKPAHTEAGRGETYEWVTTTAAPGGVELRDIDAREVGQSTTPSDAHNGPRE